MSEKILFDEARRAASVALRSRRRFQNIDGIDPEEIAANLIVEFLDAFPHRRHPSMTGIPLTEAQRRWLVTEGQTLVGRESRRLARLVPHLAAEKVSDPDEGRVVTPLSIDDIKRTLGIDRLTARERSILQLIANTGMTRSDIAEELGVARNAIDVALSRLRAKVVS